MSTGTHELKIRRILRGMSSAIVIGSVLNVFLYAFIAPAAFWPVAVFAAGMAVLAVFAVCSQTRAIRHLRSAPRDQPVMHRGAFIQPEVGLPPGFVLPSVSLAPPRSNPPMSALPPTARESQKLADAGRAQHDGFMSGLNGISMELAGARLSAMFGCAHPGAVPVDLLVTGERVAWLCTDPKCDAQLPVEWAGPLP